MIQTQISGPDLRESRRIATPARPEQPARLAPQWRNLLLTVHIVVAVGVIGADVSVITLGVTGLMSGASELIRASYLVMELLVESVLLPLAFAALLTGLLLGVGTSWGLTRYYWVLAKLALTISAATVLVFVLRSRVSQAAAEVLQVPLAELAMTGIGKLGVAVTVGPAVALPVLLTVVVLAIYKPWGQTRFRKTGPA